MAQERFISGKKDDCHHEGRRITVRRMDEATEKYCQWVKDRETAHEPVARYFTLFHGEHQLYSAMKPAKAAIDALINDGTLIGQLTLDGEVEVYKADLTIKEPIDIAS